MRVQIGGPEGYREGFFNVVLAYIKQVIQQNLTADLPHQPPA